MPLALFSSGLLLAGALAVSSAPAAPAGEDASVQLEAIVVSGQQPGPGLWRVSKGEHVLWLVGTLSPVPGDVDWRPAELDERLAEAQALLEAPGLTVDTGRGRFRSMLLAPSLIGVRNNPGRATLQDVLEPELHARWLHLKSVYLGSDRRVERWRPVFAAHRLHQAAVEQAGLSFGSPAARRVRERIAERGLPVVPAEVEIVIDDPRAALREFRAHPVDDVECFRRTLDRLEADIDLLRLRANAWATGDVQALRALHAADPESQCIRALLSTPALLTRGLDDLEARVRRTWLAAAETALEEHPVSIGLMPTSQLVDPEGYLADLRARGYRVVAPDEEVDAGEE